MIHDKLLLKYAIVAKIVIGTKVAYSWVKASG